MKQIKSVEVYYNDRLVGTLAETKENLTAFQYSKTWLSEGFSICPFSLPLSDKLFFSNYEPFGGLFGVFDDCLPDGWGMLLTDRMLRSKGLEPKTVNKITRLSLLGPNAKGALEFKPCQMDLNDNSPNVDFDSLYEQCSKILQNNKDVGDYDNLFSLAGSSGGAGPKAYVQLDDGEFIVKFPSSDDTPDIGVQEYNYCMMAKKCGIRTVECRLLPSKKTKGYFACRRFDRTPNAKRIHMLSAGGLLEVSHRFPMLDYSHLLKATMVLSKNTKEIENMFSIMCFNVFAHNRDDHAKNFSFLYSENKGAWEVAPAYDLTYSNSFNGEHATTVNGNGKNPTDNDMIEVAKEVDLDPAWCSRKINEIRSICSNNLV